MYGRMIAYYSKKVIVIDWQNFTVHGMEFAKNTFSVTLECCSS